MQSEIWKPVVGWEDSHEVSNCGRVRTFARVVSSGRGWAKILKPRELQGTVARRMGYIRVTLAYEGRVSKRTVHSLVAEAFLGPMPAGATLVRHLNGQPQDNALANIAYGTSADNAADAAAHGSYKGERNGRAKLTSEQVQALKQAPTGSIGALASEYGITASYASNIRAGKTWRHLA